MMTNNNNNRDYGRMGKSVRTVLLLLLLLLVMRWSMSTNAGTDNPHLACQPHPPAVSVKTTSVPSMRVSTNPTTARAAPNSPTLLHHQQSEANQRGKNQSLLVQKAGTGAPTTRTRE
jgi:hypothetical protein